MLEGEEISCGHCGWYGKVSKMRLRQIMPSIGYTRQQREAREVVEKA